MRLETPRIMNVFWCITHLTFNTYVYNSNSQTWSEWEFTDPSVTALPLVGYTTTNSSRLGNGILANGELVYFIDNFQPYDGLGATGDGYIESGYIDATYYAASTQGKTNPINMVIRLDNWDNGNRDFKYLHQLRFVGDATEDSNQMVIKWEDDNNLPNVYTHSATIDISNAKNKVTRLGRFKSRTFEFQYQGTEQIRFLGVDLDISEGTH